MARIVTSDDAYDVIREDGWVLKVRNLMRQMCWWWIWDSFEVCNNFGVPRYSRNLL